MAKGGWQRGRILRGIVDGRRELVELVRSLVRAPSENPPGDQAVVMGVIKDYLAEQGVPFEAAALRPDQENLIARMGPPGGRRSLLLYGHTDVVPAGDPGRWSFPPYGGDLRDGWILGRGAADMKAGTGAALFTAALIHRLEVPLGGPLLFHANPDEEDFLPEEKLLYRLLDDGRLACTACVMGEPTGLGHVAVGDKGDLWLRLRCRGRPAHGSAPMLGDSALEACLGALGRLRALLSSPVSLPTEVEPLVAESRAVARARARMLGQPGRARAVARALDRTTMNVGRLRAGSMINVVPDDCEAEVALCVPPGLSPAKLAAVIREELASLAEVEVLAATEPNFTPPGDPLVAALRDAGRQVLGRAPSPIHDLATSDAHAFRLRGIPTLLFGPGDLGLAHGLDERVSVEETVALAKVLALTSMAYLGEG